jgi:Transcriptional regulator, AbiEi antitoxin
MARSMSRAKERGANAWGLADRQHGVVARRDLLALGFSPMAIEHRTERGRLHPVYRGVYAVGRPALTCEGRWMAAVLACGDDAALSHRSAAALWGIWEEGGRIEITVRQASQRRPGGLRARRRPSLTDEDIAIHKRIPTTCPIRTLLDLATVLGPTALERAIGEADKRDLTDPETMRAALAAYTGQPGVRARRAVLDRHTLRPVRLRTRAPLPAASPGSRAPPAADPGRGQRFQGRLLLAGPGPGRRDRRPPIPPDPVRSGPRPRSRPSPHRRGIDDPPLHPPPGPTRSRPRAPRPARHRGQLLERTVREGAGWPLDGRILRAAQPIGWAASPERGRPASSPPRRVRR